MASTQTEQDESAIKHGVDTDQFQAFIDWLEDNPENGFLTLRSEGFYDGTVGRSTVHIGPYDLDGDTIDRPTRHYTIQYGAWKEIEAEGGYVGPTDRIEPVETTLSALNACLQVGVSINALRHGYEFDDIHVDVEAVVDPRVLFGVKDVGESCLQTIRADIEVEGEDLDKEAIDDIESMAERSPVHQLVSDENTIILDVESA